MKNHEIIEHVFTRVAGLYEVNWRKLTRTAYFNENVHHARCVAAYTLSHYISDADVAETLRTTTGVVTMRKRWAKNLFRQSDKHERIFNLLKSELDAKTMQSKAVKINK